MVQRWLKSHKMLGDKERGHKMQGAKRQQEVTKCAAISDSRRSQNADTPEGHKMRGDKRQPGVTTCGAIRDH